MDYSKLSRRQRRIGQAIGAAVGLVVLDALLSPTELISPVARAVSLSFTILGIGAGLAVAFFMANFPGMKQDWRRFALYPVMPGIGFVLFLHLGYRLTELASFGIGGHATTVQVYPIVDVRRAQKSASYFAEIDPFHTRDKADLEVSAQQYDALFGWRQARQLGSRCIAVRQQSAANGAVRIFVSRLFETASPRVIGPCPAGQADPETKI